MDGGYLYRCEQIAGVLTDGGPPSLTICSETIGLTNMNTLGYSDRTCKILRWYERGTVFLPIVFIVDLSSVEQQVPRGSCNRTALTEEIT